VQRYFFHLQSSHVVRDEEGSEHQDLDAAKCHAVQMIAQVLCERPKTFWEADTYRVTVTDERGLVLFTVEMFSVQSAALNPARRL
jgi:hypothetical protein